MDRKYNILICPLEWGLGHAARMIPLARMLKEMNHNVIIASGEEHLALFRDEITGLKFIPFPGFKPGYSRYFPQYFHMLLKIPELLWHIVSEHFRIKKIIKDNSIDILISDNRFGLWNSELTTVYVTHMPRIPFPRLFRFLEPAGVLLHRTIINKYSFCFIPDLPGPLNLSGRLSHGFRQSENTRYIGILSRFADYERTQKISSDSLQHVTIILSGPEPQKEILKQKLISLLKDKEFPVIILEGKPGESREVKSEGNLTFHNHLPGKRLSEIIESGDQIITRSGYTTIMELVSLNCTALLIPTPGQTEQEYLAEYLSGNGWFETISQRKLNTLKSLSLNKTVFPAQINEDSKMLLAGAVKELLEKHHEKSESERTRK